MGAKVIDHVSKDLQLAFSGLKGFSRQNLKYMRTFAEEFTLDVTMCQLPWGHIITLMYTVADKTERRFYINEAIQKGWSRNALSMHIETNLFKRQGKVVKSKKAEGEHAQNSQ